MDDDVGEIHEITKVFEWRIKDFFNSSEKLEECYISPYFEFNNISDWYLMIKLNGSSVEDTIGCIDLYLVRESEDSFISLELSFSVKSIHGINMFENHSVAIFKEGVSIHLINWFTSRSELIKRKSEFVPSGVFTIVCHMKTQKSTENAKLIPKPDQKCYEQGRGTGVILRRCGNVFHKQASIRTCAPEVCSYCEKLVDSGRKSAYEKKCMVKPVKCAKCSEVILFENYYGHEYHPPRKTNAESLGEDFKKMLIDGCDHDVIFKTNDQEIPAHKDVLRARCRVFKSMLSHNMQERNTGVIDVPDCDPQAMKLFLSYIYSGKVEKIEQSTMLGLYYIADKYEMDELKVECSEFIKQAICPTNFCSIIQLAINHSDFSLLDFATEYFKNNMVKVFCTVEWQLFLKENSTVANELLIKSHKM